MDARLGADLFHRGIHARGLGDEGLGVGFHLFPRHDPHFEGKAAIGGGDVMGGAALDHADMQRGEGGIEGQRLRAAGLALNPFVAPVGPLDQPRAFHDGRDAIGKEGGMHLEPFHMNMKARAALVAVDDLHQGGFADDGGGPFRNHALHGGDHGRGAGAAHLFVIAQCDLEGACHPALMRLDQGPEGEGIESLHVAGAAAIEAAIAFRHRPGIRGPVLPFDRDDIGMARQDDRPLFPRPDMGKERGLGAIFMPVAMRRDAVGGEVVLDPVDQGKVGVAADSGEFYQPIKDLARRQRGGGGHSVHSPLLRPRWRQAAGRSRPADVTQGQAAQAACDKAKNL